MKSFHFGRNLRHCRQSQEYSQEYMAQLMGVSQSTYSRWEQSAKPMMQDNKLGKLAQSLNVPVGQLLGDANGLKEIKSDRMETAQVDEKQLETRRDFFSFIINQQTWVQKVFFIGAVLLISYACFEFLKGLLSVLK